MALYVVTGMVDEYEAPETPVGVFSTEQEAAQKVAMLNAPLEAHHAATGGARRPSAHFFYQYYGPFTLDKIAEYDTIDAYGMQRALSQPK